MLWTKKNEMHTFKIHNDDKNNNNNITIFIIHGSVSVCVCMYANAYCNRVGLFLYIPYISFSYIAIHKGIERKTHILT